MDDSPGAESRRRLSRKGSSRERKVGRRSLARMAGRHYGDLRGSFARRQAGVVVKGDAAGLD